MNSWPHNKVVLDGYLARLGTQRKVTQRQDALIRRKSTSDANKNAAKIT